MKQSSQTALLVAGLLVLAGLVAAGFWSAGRSDKAATSQTPVGNADDRVQDVEPESKRDNRLQYENRSLGLSFRYPSEWGSVVAQNFGGGVGDYAYFTFSANEEVTFGGNSTTYAVGAREFAPTDCAGFRGEKGSYRAVCQWRRLNDDGSSNSTPSVEERPLTDYVNKEIVSDSGTAVLLSSAGVRTIVRVNTKQDDVPGINFVLTGASLSQAEALARSVTVNQ